MSTPTPEQVQALAKVLWVAGVKRPVDLELQAHSVLASDWLRDLIAAERADAARQALAPVLARADEWEARAAKHRRHADRGFAASALDRRTASELEGCSAEVRAAAGGGEGQ